MNNGDKPTNPHYHGVESGLTKREYFAGLALQGIMANPTYIEVSTENMIRDVISVTDELLKQLDSIK